jgi:hypothetical protein
MSEIRIIFRAAEEDRKMVRILSGGIATALGALGLGLMIDGRPVAGALTTLAGAAYAGITWHNREASPPDSALPSLISSTSD